MAGAALAGGTALGLLFFQDHGIEFAGTFFQLAVEYCHLLSRGQWAPAALALTGGAPWYAIGTAAGLAILAACLSGGVRLPVACRAAARGTTAAALASLTGRFAHGFFHGPQHFFETGLVAHIGQGFTAAGRIAETGVTGLSSIPGLSAGAVLKARLGAARSLFGAFPGKFALGEFSQVTAAALPGL